MNICITGALGHIGSALIRNLKVSSTDKIYLIDNFLTQRYCSLLDLPSNINFCFKELNICSNKIEDVIKDSDIVVHLAAVTDSATAYKKPEFIKKINKTGLKNIANLCIKHNVSLIFPSTTSVYSSKKELVDERSKELKPQSDYAKSKLYGEKLLHSMSDKKGLQMVILRLGTIFGYSIGMRFHTAANKFIWQACSDEELTVWKTAIKQKRPYCDLNDAVEAINYIIKEKIFDNQIYNITSLNLTVSDIINVIKKYIPNLKIKYVTSRIMNQLSYEASNKKSLERGFKYQGDLDRGVKETIKKLKNINFNVIKQGL